METGETRTTACEFSLFVIPGGPALIIHGRAISPIDTGVHNRRSGGYEFLVVRLFSRICRVGGARFF